MEALILEDINVKIGDFRIENFSLSVEEGEILVVLGDNGAGKTKLLEAIAGFEKIESGKIYLQGMEITDLPPSKRGIGFISETLALFPHMSVRKNILYGTKYNKINCMEEKFFELVKIFGLENLLDRFPSTLSTGEKQKVAFARTLIVDPQIVLLDEPTSSISIRERERIDTEIRTILKKFHKSSIFVTHDENEAFAIGDSMAIMDGGKILQTGKVDDIFYHPSSEKIATFFGETNIFEGYIIENFNDEAIIDLSGIKIRAIGNFKVGTHVKIFIRPENVILTNKIHDVIQQNVFHAKVLKILPRGLFMKVSADIGITIVSFLTRSLFEEMNLIEGMELYIEFKKTSVHLIPD
uniref:ABC transporter ATP-binding protein n=1 Tax=Mesoaciditoga lauensis TaxID=1495039 RepID=A0A7V3RF43_9BACT